MHRCIWSPTAEKSKVEQWEGEAKLVVSRKKLVVLQRKLEEVGKKIVTSTTNIKVCVVKNLKYPKQLPVAKNSKRAENVYTTPEQKSGQVLEEIVYGALVKLLDGRNGMVKK